MKQREDGEEDIKRVITIYTLHQILINQIEVMRRQQRVTHRAEIRNVGRYRVLIEKLKGKSTLGTSRCR
jgi:hypothetical protein